MNSIDSILNMIRTEAGERTASARTDRLSVSELELYQQVQSEDVNEVRISITNEQIEEIMHAGASNPSYHSSIDWVIETTPEYAFIDSLGVTALPVLRKLLAEDFHDQLVVIHLLGKHEPFCPEIPEEALSRVQELRRIWLEFIESHSLLTEDG
ncbi:TPA: hypothetical protein DCG61_02320 [Patescibacteria group bacterium]|jgi:hypothetical protein|nr:hypothetical protein [Patescibacteria group bacterium]